MHFESIQISFAPTKNMINLLANTNQIDHNNIYHSWRERNHIIIVLLFSFVCTGINAKLFSLSRDFNAWKFQRSKNTTTFCSLESKNKSYLLYQSHSSIKLAPVVPVADIQRLMHNSPSNKLRQATTYEHDNRFVRQFGNNQMCAILNRIENNSINHF